jgi:hypothetical protein
VKGLTQKATIAAKMPDKFANRSSVGQVAAPFARNEQLAAGALHFFQEQGTGTYLGSLTGSHQSSRAGPDDDHIVDWHG